jgi:hypothetical protein
LYLRVIVSAPSQTEVFQVIVTVPLTYSPPLGYVIKSALEKLQAALAISAAANKNRITATNRVIFLFINLTHLSLFLKEKEKISISFFFDFEKTKGIFSPDRR